jgi:hypothetical protein
VDSGRDQTEIEAIFAEALAKFDLAERIIFLDRACGRHTDLRRYVDGMFRFMEETEDSPESPPGRRAAGPTGPTS